MVEKSTITVVLIEMPVLLVLIFQNQLASYLLKVAGYNPYLARVLFMLVFAFSGLASGILYLVVQFHAQSQVVGKRFLVGHAYDLRGIAKPVKLEIAEFSLLKKLKYKGKDYFLYAIWKVKKDTRICSFLLITPTELEEALSASSRWEIPAGFWFSKATVYPVTLMKLEGKAIDVFREYVGLDPSIDVYFMRDFPALITEETEARILALRKLGMLDEIGEDLK